MWERGSDHAHCERGHAIVYGALVSVIKVRGRVASSGEVGRRSTRRKWMGLGAALGASDAGT